MRRRVVETLTLVLVLAVVRLGLGQETLDKPQGGLPPSAKKEPSRTKSKLEQMLAEALKNNPDIRVAVAKLAEADAELNRTRLQVTQKVVALYYAIETQQKVVAHEEVKAQRIHQLKNAVPQAVIAEATQALTLAKAKLAELEAQMPGLIGKVAHADENVRWQAVDWFIRERLDKIPLSSNVDLNTIRRRIWLDLTGTLPPPGRLQAKAAGPLADTIRKALDKPVSLKMEIKVIPEVLRLLQKQTGINIKVMTDDLPDPQVNLELTDVSFRAALQYIEDSEPGYRFVIREYGILFASDAKLPPGALTVQEFLRQKPAEK